MIAPIPAFEQPQAPDHISPSQLEKFGDCPRKWGWGYLDKIKSPPNAYATFGLGVHAQIEAYLTKGVSLDLTTDHGNCAMAGLHLLPPPGTPGMAIEQGFHLKAWGHLFLGYKDIEVITSGPLRISGIAGFEFGNGIPLVEDHKTTSDPVKWGKTPAQLAENFQGVIYATDAMIKTGAQACDLLWIYYKRKAPHRAVPVHVRVTREMAGPTLETIKGLSDDIRDIRAAGLKAKDLPYNADSCDKYGGCPYKTHCNLTPQERFASFMTQQAPTVQSKDQFLQVIAQAQKAAGGAGANLNPPPVPPASTGLPPGSQVSPDGSQYWAPGMAAWAPVPAPPPVMAAPPMPPPMVAPPMPPATVQFPPGTQFSPDGSQAWVNGAWAPTGAPPAPMGAPTPPPTVAGPPPLPPAAAEAPPMPPPAGGPPPLPIPQVNGTADAPNKRGRPKGSKNKAGGVQALGSPGAEGAEGDDPTAAALDMISEGFAAWAAAVRNG